MNPISVSLTTYLLAIVFAMLIAIVIKGLALLLEALGLNREDEVLDIAVPTSNSMKEEEAIAVAIAIAHARHK